jgi:hypothetical protein
MERGRTLDYYHAGRMSRRQRREITAIHAGKILLDIDRLKTGGRQGSMRPRKGAV